MRTAPVIAILTLVACNSGSLSKEQSEAKAVATQAPAKDDLSGGFANEVALSEEEAGEAAPSAPKMAERKKMRSKGTGSGYGRGGGGLNMFDAKDKPADDAPGAAMEKGVASRSWFPETFLFEPLIVTDKDGKAEHVAKVPDRLTTWRVLALAHSRKGTQAGTVTSFLGTLDFYVDLILPPKLRAGDSLRVPLQFVNTTDKAGGGAVRFAAEGAAASGAPGPVSIPARGNLVRYAKLDAPKAGSAQVHAQIGERDAVTKKLDIDPTGKPVDLTKAGTLASPRKFSLTIPANANPEQTTARLQVFPGGLAILRSELAAVIARGGAAEDAFALLLVGQAPELLAAFGDKANPDAIRESSIILTQRVVRHARTLDMVNASLFAEAALAHEGNPVLERIGKRAITFIERGQRPDGTCGGETGWTVQRLLVATAECARAARSSKRVSIRASGAFERHFKLIDDPYTAAAVLAAGGVTGERAEALRKMITDALKDLDDGSKMLPAPDDVVRADGYRPNPIEATALAVLALKDDPKAPVADLGAMLLANYSPGWGWGDGRTNLAAIRAVLELFKDPLPDGIEITLKRGGAVLAKGTLTKERIRDVLILNAEGLNSVGVQDFEVTAEPAVPGLGFALAVTAWVPWTADKATGLELQVPAPTAAQVGRIAEIPITATAPSGRALHVKLPLPAGVQPDEAGLQALVPAGTLSRYQTSDGLIELFAPPLEPAKLFRANVKVVPTFAGTLSSGAPSIKAGGVTVHVPPTRWIIK
jgi:hypothetical protein